jgi:mannose-P-dolichol utilization defect 1
VFNYLLGSLSRIFTTLQEVPDPLILYGFVAGFALNAILALQMIWYWNSPTSKKTPAKKLKSIAADKESPSYASVASGKAKSPSTRRRG